MSCNFNRTQTYCSEILGGKVFWSHYKAERKKWDKNLLSGIVHILWQLEVAKYKTIKLKPNLSILKNYKIYGQENMNINGF